MADKAVKLAMLKARIFGQVVKPPNVRCVLACACCVSSSGARPWSRCAGLGPGARCVCAIDRNSTTGLAAAWCGVPRCAQATPARRAPCSQRVPACHRLAWSDGHLARKAAPCIGAIVAQRERISCELVLTTRFRLMHTGRSPSKYMRKSLRGPEVMEYFKGGVHPRAIDATFKPLRALSIFKDEDRVRASSRGVLASGLAILGAYSWPLPHARPLPARLHLTPAVSPRGSVFLSAGLAREAAQVVRRARQGDCKERLVLPRRALVPHRARPSCSAAQRVCLSGRLGVRGVPGSRASCGREWTRQRALSKGVHNHVCVLTFVGTPRLNHTRRWGQARSQDKGQKIRRGGRPQADRHDAHPAPPRPAPRQRPRHVCPLAPARSMRTVRVLRMACQHPPVVSCGKISRAPGPAHNLCGEEALLSLNAQRRGWPPCSLCVLFWLYPHHKVPQRRALRHAASASSSSQLSRCRLILQ